MLNPSPTFYKSMELAQLGKFMAEQLWAWPDMLKESVALAILQSRDTRHHFPPVVEALMARRTTSQGSRPIRRVFAFAFARSLPLFSGRTCKNWPDFKMWWKLRNGTEMNRVYPFESCHYIISSISSHHMNMFFLTWQRPDPNVANGADRGRLISTEDRVTTCTQHV